PCALRQGEIELAIHTVGSAVSRQWDIAIGAPDQSTQVGVIANNFQLDAIWIAVDVAGLTKFGFAVDALTFSNRWSDRAQVLVDRIERNLSVGTFADFGFMPDDDHAVVSPAAVVAQRVLPLRVCVRWLLGWLAHQHHRAVGDRPNG